MLKDTEEYCEDYVRLFQGQHFMKDFAKREHGTLKRDAIKYKVCVKSNNSSKVHYQRMCFSLSILSELLF